MTISPLPPVEDPRLLTSMGDPADEHVLVYKRHEETAMWRQGDWISLATAYDAVLNCGEPDPGSHLIAWAKEVTVDGFLLRMRARLVLTKFGSGEPTTRTEPGIVHSWYWRNMETDRLGWSVNSLSWVESGGKPNEVRIEAFDVQVSADDLGARIGRDPPRTTGTVVSKPACGNSDVATPLEYSDRTGGAGRPSSMRIIDGMMRQRFDSRLQAGTMAEEADELLRLFRSETQYAGLAAPTAKTVINRLSSTYRQLKAAIPK